MTPQGPPALPDGLWHQPGVDTSVIDALTDVERVQRIRVPARLEYDYTPGLATTRFLRAIKQKRLVGERCPVTGKVYLPPRGMSPTAGVPTTEQVELGDRGTVTTYCIVDINFTGQNIETPYVSALILVDGADIPLYGLVQEIPVSEVRIGLRVEAVWVEDDQLDFSFENIKWWRPTGEPDAPLDLIREHV